MVEGRFPSLFHIAIKNVAGDFESITVPVFMKVSPSVIMAYTVPDK